MAWRVVWLMPNRSRSTASTSARIASCVWVPITKDLIVRAPELEGARALSRDDELELCFHYGGMRKRSETLKRRPPVDVTAVPGSAVVPFRQSRRGAARH
jgi:hypothetical protein